MEAVRRRDSEAGGDGDDAAPAAALPHARPSHRGPSMAVAAELDLAGDSAADSTHRLSIRPGERAPRLRRERRKDLDGGGSRGRGGVVALLIDERERER